MRFAVLALAVCLAACSTEPVGTLSGSDGGSGDAAVGADAGSVADSGTPADATVLTCVGQDEMTCALSNCLSTYCPDCDGNSVFEGCHGGGQGEPSCPDVFCPSDCRSLDEAACQSMGALCRVDICPGCRDDDFFVGCAAPSDPPPPCPPVWCPPCEELDESQCAEDPGCHRVFEQEVEQCLCDSPGCCHVFTGCAEGRTADCRGENLSCRMVEPYCAGPYVISYEGTCYEGCVLAEDC